MKTSPPRQQYDQADEARFRRDVELADAQNLKRSAAVTYILMSKPDGTVGKLTINSSGSPIWTAL